MVEIFENIRKIYQFSQPCEELKDFVEFFSESSRVTTQQYFGNKGFSVKMFPSFTPTFWINLGPAYHLLIGNTQRFIKAGEDIAVVRDIVTERINHPADHIFTVKFFPGGLKAVFNINQPQMAGDVVELRTILPSALLINIKLQDNFEARVKLLQDYMLLKLGRKRGADHYTNIVMQSIAFYQHGNLQYNVNEVAARSFISSKSINRYFNRVIGTHPKNYFSITRARTALTAYVNDRSSFDPCSYGYYDTSHFYKDVINFTGHKLVDHSI